MSKSPKFLTVADFAARAGVTPRVARRALRQCAEGGAWRGAPLDVSVAHGRGGRGGAAYLVRAESLPPELRPPAAPTPEPEAVPATRPRAGAKRGALPGWKLDLILPIVRDTEPATPERRRAVAEAARTARWAEGKRAGWPVSPSAIRRWIAEYEARGAGALARERRADRGRERVAIGREFDAHLRALGLDEGARAAVASELRRFVRSQWAGGAPSYKVVQFNATALAMRLAREAGSELPDADLRRIAKLPRRFVESERTARAVAIYRKDAGRSADVQVPRITRDRSALRPGEWVAADVHHLDVLVRREDGTLATPKLVAWVDLATNRVFGSVHLFAKGEMIRREHVLANFAAMCADSNWGVPTRLYMDRGGEYNWEEFVSDLLALKGWVDEDRIAGKLDAKFERLPWEPGVTRSRPYNPQSKVIESVFAALERCVLEQLPGHIGGDRFRKKTQMQGRAPEPFPGGIDAFRAAFATGLDYYHAKPQTGHLAGASPAEAFAREVEGGWKSTVLDPGELEVAFAREEARTVYAGGIVKSGGRVYRHDALIALAGVGRVRVRAPLFGARERIYVFDAKGKFLCVAIPERDYAFGDPRGAGEQARRRKVLTRQIRAIEARCDRQDPLAVMGAAVAAQGAPALAPVGAVVGISESYRRAAEAARALPERSEAEARLARQREEYERFERLGERLAAGDER